MRTRPIVALSIAALSAVLLAGCASGTPSAGPSASPTATTAANLCDAQAAPGKESDSVVVTGDTGTSSTATFSTPLDVDKLQATVITEGSGDPLVAGDLISYGLTAYSAKTGEQLGVVGYDAPALPLQASPDSPVGQILGCAKPGARVVAVFPATDQADGEVYIFDFFKTVPSAAWGAAQDAPAGLPTVKLADNGEPTITLPGGDAPTDLQLATLKKGDGPVVQQGDYVLVQYTGVKWSDGTVFDSSWEHGTPAQFQTTGVVPGFQQAIEGQTVGSQVLVVIPPALGYGEGEINSTDLKGETLVFVVDILGTQTATAPAQ